MKKIFFFTLFLLGIIVSTVNAATVVSVPSENTAAKSNLKSNYLKITKTVKAGDEIKIPGLWWCYEIGRVAVDMYVDMSGDTWIVYDIYVRCVYLEML